MLPGARRDSTQKKSQPQPGPIPGANPSVLRCAGAPFSPRCLARVGASKFDPGRYSWPTAGLTGSRRRQAAELWRGRRIIPPTHVGGYALRLPAGSAWKQFGRFDVRSGCGLEGCDWLAGARWLGLAGLHPPA